MVMASHHTHASNAGLDASWRCIMRYRVRRRSTYMTGLMPLGLVVSLIALCAGTPAWENSAGPTRQQGLGRRRGCPARLTSFEEMRWSRRINYQGREDDGHARQRILHMCIFFVEH